MIDVTHKSTIYLVMTVILFFNFFTVSAVAAVNNKGQVDINKNTPPISSKSEFDVARLKLESAVINYKKGDMAATKHDLEEAIEWLNKAANNSDTENSKEEARKLGIKIDALKGKLNQSSEENENSLVRFWHQSIAILEREIDHLKHSYIESLETEQSLKYLLDAKMHLYTAEHDLLVSHNNSNSEQELDSVIKYLGEAEQVAKKHTQKRIIILSKKIYSLREMVKRNQEAWRDNEEILFLSQATDNLAKAKDNAPPGVKLRIESIESDIQALKTDIERINIKNNYESSMETLKDIINEL